MQTDAGLRSSTEILNLANLFISAEGLRVRQVPFQTVPCTTTCPAGDLTATPQQIEGTVHDFLFGAPATPTRQVAAISHRIHGHGGLARLPLTPTLASNVAAEKAAAAKLRFTAEFPKVQDLSGSVIPVAARCTAVVQACIRNYLIRSPNGHAYPIYVEVFSNGDLGQYYDVQGTTWTDAPLFANPAQTIRVGARTYDLYYSGATLKVIAWHDYGAVYWVSNTLTDAVGNGELLAIAEQTAPVAATRTRPSAVVLRSFSVPAPSAPAVATPLLQSIGRIGGVVTMVLLLPLSLLTVLISAGRIRSLRAQLLATVTRTAMLETRMATPPAKTRRSP